MNVTREVILDLLPVYLAGEASPATRALVEEYLKQDPELAQKIRIQWSENFAKVAPSALPPDLELRSLSRARKLLALQRWVFAFAITFTAISLAIKISTQGGEITSFHLLIQDYPVQLGICSLLALVCWVGYYFIRRRLRTS